MSQSLSSEQALQLWHSVFVSSVSDARSDLTMRQMAMLLSIYLSPPPHTVRGLAKSLNISKPAVTRALNKLGDMGLVKRKRDDDDRRSVLVQRTVKGSVYLSDVADVIAAASTRVGTATESAEAAAA